MQKPKTLFYIFRCTSSVNWLIDEVKPTGNNFPKSIIFCNTLKEFASVVNLLLLKLSEYAYAPVVLNDRKDFIVRIFHSVSWPNHKKVKKELLH